MPSDDAGESPKTQADAAARLNNAIAELGFMLEELTDPRVAVADLPAVVAGVRENLQTVVAHVRGIERFATIADRLTDTSNLLLQRLSQWNLRPPVPEPVVQQVHTLLSELGPGVRIPALLYRVSGCAQRFASQFGDFITTADAPSRRRVLENALPELRALLGAFEEFSTLGGHIEAPGGKERYLDDVRQLVASLQRWDGGDVLVPLVHRVRNVLTVLRVHDPRIDDFG